MSKQEQELYSYPLSISVTPTMAGDITRDAKQLGLSRSQFLRTLYKMFKESQKQHQKKSKRKK